MTIYITSPDRTTTFSANRNNVIEAAARKLGVIGTGETLGAEDYTNFTFGLNCVLKSYMKDGYQLWKISDLAVPLVSGTATYQIGPTATGTGAVITDRPLRVIDSSYVRDSAGLDTTLQILSRQEYNQLGLKSTSSTVSQIFYDPQLTNGVLHVYGTPNDSTQTAYLTVQMPVYDMNNANDTLDFPQECYQAIVYGLAEEMIEEYPPHDQLLVSGIIRKAEMYRQQISDWSQEEASIFFQPSSSIRHR